MHNKLQMDVSQMGLVGAIVSVRLDSDSGLVSDLNKAEFSEKVVQTRKDSPPFGLVWGTTTSGYLPCTTTGKPDNHTTSRPEAGPEGWSLLSQLFIFKCARCGAQDKVQPNTGMSIIHHVFKVGSQWKYNFRKLGKKTTLKQGGSTWTSEAGDANVTPPDHDLP
jgi:hypothetical protein